MVENRPEFYSLNAPGIAVLVKGESYRRKPLFAEKLASKIKPLTPGHFAGLPISNIGFYQNEQGGYDNASAFVEIDGFDESVLTLLQRQQATAVSILEVNEAVAVFSGCHHLVQIGFNGGGGEIVFKRILLPRNYQLPADWPSEPSVYQGSKMPEVFVEAWDKLGVGDWDREWDERVREQLVGNSRDMNRRIVYQMVDGEKWVEWNGVKIWAGLLSDRRDIDRFLAEEQALAGLKPGEFLAAKYSHGGGGAISAATSQEREKEKPQIVGDVQMMGPNGEIFQGAVEGGAEEIDGLIGGLVDQLRRDYNLAAPETILPLQPWLVGLPVLPLAAYPAKFLLADQVPVGPEPMVMMPAAAVAERTESFSLAEPPAVGGGYWTTDESGLTDFEWGFNLSSWQEPDNDPDSDGGGDWDDGGSGFDWPEEPVSGGGLGFTSGPGLEVQEVVEDDNIVEPTKTVLDITSSSEPEVTTVAEPARTVPIGVQEVELPSGFHLEDPKTAELVPTKTVYIVVPKREDQPTGTVLVGRKDHPGIRGASGATIKPTRSHLEGRVLYQRKQSREIVSRLHGGTEAILPPLWQVKLEPLNDKEIPFWQPGFNDFEINDALVLVVVTMFFLIANTVWRQPEQTFFNSRGSVDSRQRAVMALS